MRAWWPVIAMVALAALAIIISNTRHVSAHCDTMAGPVVMTARSALETGDVTPVLKWVKPAQEAEIREAFSKTLAVRKMGPEARDLADMYFFETLVRLHRQSEGAPFTGLKTAEAMEPIIAATDKAIETGSVDPLVRDVTDVVGDGIRERFARVRDAKAHADDSVAAGREYVEAYVEFTHYVERIHDNATGSHEDHADHAASAPIQHLH